MTNTTPTLPTFESLMTYQNKEGELIETSICLNEYVKKSDKGLILYFYPKDNTAGCTVQATDFSEYFDKFAALGYAIIGVSRDSIKSHQNFIKKHALTLGLISDADEKLCQHFDVIKEKNMYGKKVLGVVRSTFVFDKTGNLIHELRNVKAKEHSEKLMALLSH